MSASMRRTAELGIHAHSFDTGRIIRNRNLSVHSTGYQIVCIHKGETSMSNHETFKPMGLIDITKELTKPKRDEAEKEVEVNLDPITEQLMTPDHRKQLDDAVKRNQGHWQAGYDEGFKAGSLSSTEPPTSRIVSLAEESEQRDRELLEEHGIDVDGFVSDTVKMIEDHKGRKIDEE